MILRVTIPFQAIPAARPRADFIRGKGGAPIMKTVLNKRTGKHVSRPILRAYVPTRSMEWVYVVRRAMLEEAERARLAAPWSEAVELSIYAFNACPKSDRKADKAALRWNTKRGSDPDNIAKSIMDAGNEVWWQDDAQIAALTVKTFVAQEGEPSSVLVEARAMPIVVGAVRRLAAATPEKK